MPCSPAHRDSDRVVDACAYGPLARHREHVGRCGEIATSAASSTDAAKAGRSRGPARAGQAVGEHGSSPHPGGHLAPHGCVAVCWLVRSLSHPRSRSMVRVWVALPLSRACGLESVTTLPLRQERRESGHVPRERQRKMEERERGCEAERCERQETRRAEKREGKEEKQNEIER